MICRTALIFLAQVNSRVTCPPFRTDRPFTEEQRYLYGIAGQGWLSFNRR